MSDHTDLPDLSTLPQRMRFAADVMDQAKTRLEQELYGALYPAHGASEWNSEALRERADIWEAQDRDAAEKAARESLIRELSWAFYETERWSGGAPHQKHRNAARKLVESGWRKGDSPS